MKWYSYLFCFILIIAGVFCSIGLYNEFTNNSGVYGTFESVETVNKFDEVLKVDEGVIPFESSDYVNYSAKIAQEPVKFDGSKEDYAVLFNGNLLSDVEIYSGKITAVITLNFYNTEGAKVATAVVNVLIEFLDSNTIITFTTKNENNSFAYLNQYMNVNGAILKVVTREAK